MQKRQKFSTRTDFLLKFAVWLVFQSVVIIFICQLLASKKEISRLIWSLFILKSLPRYVSPPRNARMLNSSVYDIFCDNLNTSIRLGFLRFFLQRHWDL